MWRLHGRLIRRGRQHRPWLCSCPSRTQISAVDHATGPASRREMVLAGRCSILYQVSCSYTGEISTNPLHLLEGGMCNGQAFLSRGLQDAIVSRSHNHRTKLRFLECKAKRHSGCDLDGIGCAQRRELHKRYGTLDEVFCHPEPQIRSGTSNQKSSAQAITVVRGQAAFPLASGQCTRDLDGSQQGEVEQVAARSGSDVTHPCTALFTTISFHQSACSKKIQRPHPSPRRSLIMSSDTGPSWAARLPRRSSSSGVRGCTADVRDAGSLQRSPRSCTTRTIPARSGVGLARLVRHRCRASRIISASDSS